MEREEVRTPRTQSTLGRGSLRGGDSATHVFEKQQEGRQGEGPGTRGGGGGRRVRGWPEPPPGDAGKPSLHTQAESLREEQGPDCIRVPLAAMCRI